MANAKWSRAEIERAVALCRSGVLQRDIALLTGQHIESVRRVLRAEGATTPQTRGRRTDDEWSIHASVASMLLAQAIRRHHPGICK